MEQATDIVQSSESKNSQSITTTTTTKLTTDATDDTLNKEEPKQTIHIDTVTKVSQDVVVAAAATAAVAAVTSTSTTSSTTTTTTTSTTTSPSKPTTTTTNTTSKYLREFQSLFEPLKSEQLQIRARNGSLKSCKFRSLCWRYFLNCLPKRYDDWLGACNRSRKHYEEITLKYSSQQYNNEQAANVKRTIERDVIRTFPDMEFFRQSDIQGILGRVLYNFACENPRLSYKQGMHELLATLLYVLQTDSQDCLINFEGGYATQSIATLLDLKYLEHDVFHLFSAFMSYIEPWYQNDDTLIIQDDGMKRPSSVLSVKLKKISENIVKFYDPELFNHLEALQIAPQIYGIRWMRLVFGREFEFLDLLIIWDALICDHQNPMSLTDFVFASMLLTIREELVNGDYTDCLNNLMRYQFKDVQFVIKLALHIHDPIDNPRPQSRSPTSSSSSILLSSGGGGGGGRLGQLSQQTASKLYVTNDKRCMQQQQPKITYTNNKSQSTVSNLSSLTRPVGQLQQQQLQRNMTKASNISSSHSPSYSSLSTRLLSAATTTTTRTPTTSIATRQQPTPATNSSTTRNSNSSSRYNQPSNQSTTKPIREYEMREILTNQSSKMRSQMAKFPIGYVLNSIGGGSGSGVSHDRSAATDYKQVAGVSGSVPRGNVANISTESYDDLPSIVDYCWRLLSEQIDSLQRCLPKEKSLHSEDEIFVALAQLKKVRDVLKGSLRLEDELESASGGGGGGNSNSSSTIGGPMAQSSSGGG